MPGSGTGPDHAERVRAEYRVAELLVGHADGGMELERHLERVGDGLGLIEVTGARTTDVKLLQGHDVGLVAGDDPGDPFG